MKGVESYQVDMEVRMDEKEERIGIKEIEKLKREKKEVKKEEG